MSENSSTTKVLLALLAGAGIGAAIGAGAALLLTPNDGKTNRKKLKNKINQMSSDFHETAENIMDEIEDGIEELTKSQTEKPAEDGQ
ncbi:YtxH domain-containing protein [Lentimicrobium sp. S6]|uniref:YtxH domain-containing protein n=1 Tax=Lentimicrobium sp. S6 TaxID=2735872 RepID=UPI0015533F22|nr:YtxH domain-containing protein [Lentimicrobium sp. S6]NPD46605.1 YtxH domain-containing protein [Lentimicrobium sp. S6]